MTSKEFERRLDRLYADWDAGRITPDEYDREYLAICADAGMLPDWTGRDSFDPRAD